MIKRKPKSGQLYEVKNLAGDWVSAVYMEQGEFAQWEISGGGFLYLGDVSEWREVE